MFEDPGVEGRYIELSYRNTKIGFDWIKLALDRNTCCEHGNETLGFIKCGEFFD
jgi:hypothetical protein